MIKLTHKSDIKYEIGRTFPVKLGDITTITGLTLDTDASTFESRLIRIFRKVFNNATFEKDYWKLLKEMISNPNDTFGLVAIDGYYTDVMGKDDIAVVLNMGIPKLRGRRINYLDRIYCRMAAGSNLKFYNSFLDDNIDDVHFEFDDRIPAWHPHISNAEPCLGSYANDLAKWKSEGNPIMYLKTVHQFLNTWNVRSPFWNLNNTKIDHVRGKKAFKRSKIINAFHKSGNNQTRIAEKYIMDNVERINTGSFPNDIFCLVQIYHKEKMIKQNIVDDFLGLCSPETISYLRRHEHDHTDNNPQRNDTIIRPNTRILIPKQTKRNGIDTTVFDQSTIGHGALGNDTNYNSRRTILDALSRVIYDLYKWLRTTAPIDDIFKDDDYIMSMECKYHFPLISKNNIHFDEMTSSGLYDHRVYRYTSENSSANAEYYSKKKRLLRIIDNRQQRLDRLYVRHYRNKLNEESVNDIINVKLQDFFRYEIDKSNPFTNYNSETKEPEIYYHLVDVGRFWNNMGIFSTSGIFEDVEQFVKETECYKDITTLINTFELTKRGLVLEETNSLINQYDKVIRRLRDYGYKTDNTKKDTQQIHLSFE